MGRFIGRVMAGDGDHQREPGFKTAVEDVKALATVVAMEAESILGRRTARVLGALALFAAVGGLLVWYIAPSGAAEKQALVVTLAQILGGTALLSGLYFTWRTLQVNREGQITDRFTRAIDQLGKVEDGQKLFEIRVGGIYALERIVRESEEDYWPIMEILTAYVRQNAPLPPKVGQERTEDATDEQRAMEGSGGKSETTEPSAPTPDIQAIMTILRRRKRYYRHREPEKLGLSATNLTGADLTGADLTGALLSEANLSAATLTGATLTGADLRQATLSGADLFRANLTRANLFGAILMQARLFEVILTGATLTRADLSGANFGGHTGANLSGAFLIQAILIQAILTGADLTGADLTGADLTGADLIEADVTREQLEQAVGDENTQLPSHLKPPENWSVKTDEQTEEG